MPKKTPILSNSAGKRTPSPTYVSFTQGKGNEQNSVHHTPVKVPLPKTTKGSKK